MNTTTQLKLCAVMFTVLWTGWMLWSSGSLDRVNVILRHFQRSGMLPRRDHPADLAEKR